MKVETSNMGTRVAAAPRKAALSFLEEVDCILCGGRKSRTLLKGSYPEGMTPEALLAIYSSSSETKLMDTLVQCDGCSLVFLNPRPREALVLSSYSGAEDSEFVTQNEARIDTFHRSLMGLASRHGFAAESSILDVGSAGGAFLKAAKDLGYRVTGVEPNRWLSEYGRTQYGVDLRPTTLEEQKFKAESFDVVTLWDVLEHLHRPAQVLAECRRVLKPGGHLVVNFPDYDSLARRLMGHRWPFLLSVHLYYFTRATLERLLADAGFEVARHRPHWQRLELGYVLKRGAALLPFLASVRKAGWFRPFARRHVPYQLGQTLTVAVRRAT